MTHSISFEASRQSRRPSDAIRHLYIAGMLLPAPKRLVAMAEIGGCESATY